MSATQDLIAAALSAADMLDELNSVAHLGGKSARNLREACARAMVQPDVSEVERLVEEFGRLKWSAGCSSGNFDSGAEMMSETEAYEVRSVLLDAVRAIVAERDALKHDRRGAVQKGDDGKRVLREVFALCEDTEAKCSEDTNDFNRGRLFEAKGIARAIGIWYQDEFCGQTHMGEPTPAPDQFRDAAKMLPDGCKPIPTPITESMHVAAAKVLIRANGLDGTPQRMLDAMLAAAPQPVGEIKAVEGIPIPTGHAEADRIIGRLMSSDPDFQDCIDAAALIQREICGPDGFATWREAAIAERIKRTQPVGEVPMLDADATAYALHNYGDAREAAGYAAGVAAGDELTAATRSVLIERRRQINLEGWIPEHDDAHSTEEMALAAACYCTADKDDAPPAIWPWNLFWWKPTSRRRNLVKAGALILAEIERLDRAALRGEVK